MITEAEVLAADKRFLWMRVPDLHPNRILMLDAALWPDLTAGDKITVEARGGIERRQPSGWTAYLVAV